jgi:hypothetical protein
LEFFSSSPFASNILNYRSTNKKSRKGGRIPEDDTRHMWNKEREDF